MALLTPLGLLLAWFQDNRMSRTASKLMDLVHLSLTVCSIFVCIFSSYFFHMQD
ncbi:hypothetical protein CPB83DRAFT_861138 [Crepidotus variabilis]|uniref:Uncharacterized protein n=1 Tax=Crepidotus variabilis TaxID=179855 RepID=A0A9P6E8Y4_9AGAR|nr:hypothetical protein CPB83DRAFT_861138 [Crepidotus variabilis]